MFNYFKIDAMVQMVSGSCTDCWEDASATALLEVLRSGETKAH